MYSMCASLTAFNVSIFDAQILKERRCILHVHHFQFSLHRRPLLPVPLDAVVDTAVETAVVDAVVIANVLLVAIFCPYSTYGNATAVK